MRNSFAQGATVALGLAVSSAAGADEPPGPIEEVVVTASGFQQSLADAPASITVITAAELETRRIRDLADALATVEGVDVGAPLGKSGGREISLRGMPADYTLFLIDGRRQDAAGNVTPNGFGHTRTNFMPPATAIERIEVVRGPMSTLYGADAMGGVVNIITRTPGDVWSGDVKVDYTMQSDDDFGDDSTINVYLDGPLIPGRLTAALRGGTYQRDESFYRYLDDAGEELEDGGIAGGPAVTELDVTAIGGRLTFMPSERHRIWLDVDVNEQVYDNSAGQLGTLGSGGYDDELEFKREQVVLAYNAELLGGLLEADITHNTTETIGRTLPADVPGTDRRAGDPRRIEATNDMFNIRLFRELGNHALTVGGQYWEAEMIEGLNPEPFEHDQSALFVEDEWRLTDPLALTLGARYDHHSVFGSHVSPRAYLVYSATPSLTLKGGVSAGYKAPSLDQLADGIIGFGGQGTIPLIGTPSLEPETSTNYEIGFHYDNGAGLVARGVVYYNDFEDKIASGPGIPNCSFGVSPDDYAAGNYSRENCLDVGYYPSGRGGPIVEFGQSVNVDEAETQGFELSIRKNLLDSLIGSLSYTYSDSEQKSGEAAGEPLTNLPRHRVTGNLNWDVNARLSLWLRGEYSSSRYRGTGRADADAQEQLGDYDAFSLFSLGGSYQLTPSLRLSAMIENLLDEDFIDYRPYLTGGSVAYANTYAIAEEPRRLWLSLQATF